jgi:hypothetical protein
LINKWHGMGAGADRSSPASARISVSCVLLALLLAVLACNFPTVREIPGDTPTDAPLPAVPPTTDAASIAPEFPFEDTQATFSNVCFAFLQTLHGQTLIVDNPMELTSFYNQVDDSEKCPDPVDRLVFDFTGRQIVGTVFTGQGCGIELDYQGTRVDDAARLRIISMTAAVSGDCPYDLVRPVWFAIERPAQGYTTKIELAS